MPASRRGTNKTLPLRLYKAGNGYYFYRHPITGKNHGMGKDRQKAIAAAHELNSIFASQTDLVEKVTKTKDMDFLTFVDKFQNTYLMERKLSEATLAVYSQKLVHVRNYFKGETFNSITIFFVAQFLNKFSPSQSNNYRSLLVQIYRYAMSQGVTDKNIPELTLVRKYTVSRQRLTVSDFYTILEYAEPWMQNAMLLGLHILQRREDLVKLKWEDIKEGVLYIKQIKVDKHRTGNISINVTPAIQQVLDRCKDGIDSPYILHKQPLKKRQSKKKDHLTQLSPDQVSRGFQFARQASLLYENLPEEQHPSFHEIRSLGIYLYEQQGFNADILAWGNPGSAMKLKYLSRHETKYLNTTPPNIEDSIQK